MLSFGWRFSDSLIAMADFNIQYEGTKFSFTVYNENNKPMFYEFLIRQEAGDPKWKWIYLPHGEVPIHIGKWKIPCEPVPCFNTENGILLSFNFIFDKKTYSVKATGGSKGVHFSDVFVASCFMEVLDTIVDIKQTIISWHKRESLCSVKDDNGKEIKLHIISKPINV